MEITVDGILKAFGGAKPVGDLLGVTLQAVWNMKTRGNIPSRHWAVLIDEAKARVGRPDVTPDQSEILSAVSFESLNAMRRSPEQTRAAS